MTTYRLTSPSFTALLTVSDDIIASADDRLDWSIGRPWEWLRAYADRKGWIIQPLIHPAHVVEIEHDGVVYEFLWAQQRCNRITRHVPGDISEDVTIDDLPDEVKELIE